MTKSICSRCGKSFKNDQAYADHVCAATGFKASTPEHLGPGFQAASEAALQRGEEQDESTS